MTDKTVIAEIQGRDVPLRIAVTCINCGHDSTLSSEAEYTAYKCPQCKSTVDMVVYDLDAIFQIEELHTDRDTLLGMLREIGELRRVKFHYPEQEWVMASTPFKEEPTLESILERTLQKRPEAG